jgi:putative transposase
VRAALPAASERRICRLLDAPRSSLRSASAKRPVRRPLDETLVALLGDLIKRHPTFGYRKLWALLRHGEACS